MQNTPIRINTFAEFCQVYGVLESVEAEAREISTEIDFEELEDVDPDKIAATLSKLIDVDGDIDKIDIDQIAENFEEIMKEENVNEDETLNEAATGMIYVLEVIGTILGNADLLHFMGEFISKKLGKKVEVGKFVKSMQSFVEGVKKVTGYPAKVIKKFFEWIGKSLGMDKASTKIMGLVGLGLATVIMLLVGVLYFPAAAAVTGTTTGILTFILSISALIGKAAEITHVIQEIVGIMKEELENISVGKAVEELTAEEIEEVLATLKMRT